MKLRTLVKILKTFEKIGCGGYEVDVDLSEDWCEIKDVVCNHDSKFVTIKVEL